MNRLLRYLFFGIVLLLVTCFIDLMRSQRSYFESRHGELDSAAINNKVAMQFGASFQDIDLRSTSGLHVEMRVLLPEEVTTDKVPLVLLLGGHETGKNAVDLVKNPCGVAFAAINYPFDGTFLQNTFLDKARLLLSIQAAFIDTPPALMLATDWLETQSWFDSNRTNLLGVSLGVPFAAATGDIDNRFKRIWLIHGAANNVEWLDHELAEHIDTDWLRKGVARLLVFLTYGNAFDTMSLISNIAPRPVTFVSAKEDERVPMQSKKALLKAEKFNHVTLLWTEGRHIGPRRKRELNQLLKIVLDRVNANKPSCVDSAD